MSISFKGDFGKLTTWEKQSRSAPELMTVISENLAEETISIIRDGMNRGVSPHGVRYPKLVMRAGQPLKRTGAMMAAWNRGRSDRNGFKVSNAKSYAGYHQFGTGIHGKHRSKIVPRSAKALRVPVKGGGHAFFASVKGTPKRMMVPHPGVLPRKWAKQYRSVVNEIFVSHFRSR